MFRTTLVAAVQAANLIAVEGTEVGEVEYPSAQEVRLHSFDKTENWLLLDQEIVVEDDGKAIAQDDEGSIQLYFEVSGPMQQAHMPDGESGSVIEGMDTPEPVVE